MIPIYEYVFPCDGSGVTITVGVSVFGPLSFGAISGATVTDASVTSVILGVGAFGSL